MEEELKSKLQEIEKEWVVEEGGGSWEALAWSGVAWRLMKYMVRERCSASESQGRPSVSQLPRLHGGDGNGTGSKKPLWPLPRPVVSRGPASHSYW